MPDNKDIDEMGKTASGHQPAVKQLEPGTVLNSRYEIVRRISGDEMGAVYLAKDRNLGDAPRAVKEIVETDLEPAEHEKAIRDFKRESLLLTSLEHPSIPTMYDYFYAEQLGRFYLVMEYISGGDVASRMRSVPGGRIDEKTVTEWAMQLADLLEYLHTRPKSIIYRNLKPAKLMIDDNTGRVMLIDSGIARWLMKQERGVTSVGTMGYAPPELFSGQADPRVDIYSLGATIFHLLTGSDPQDNPLLIFDFGKNPRPRQINPALSSEIEQILMRAVEYKPEDRFASAGAMRDSLAIHLEKLMTGQVSFGATSTQIGSETIQVQTVYCGFCGGRIAADDIFCAHCDARQPMAGLGSGAALRAARPTAKLVVAGTTELDAAFVLQKDNNLLGRTDPHSNVFPEIDLSRFDPETKVSRRHARIWREGETFLVEDQGSVHGTVINDSVRLAPRQPRVLDSGDKLRLGETTLHFLLGDRDRSPAEPPIYLDENVQFTVYRPGKIKPGRWYPLLAYAHLGEPRPNEDAFDPIAYMEEEAERIMVAQDVKDYRRASEDSLLAIPRQGEISFVPSIAGVEFNPPSSSFFWQESVHRQEFRMRASAALDGKTARGHMSVFLGTILLAEINLSIQVTSTHADTHKVRPQREKPARPYRKIFPSYSHRDREIVAQIEHYAQITGDRYMRDVYELRSGQNWKKWMAETIAEADIFQLFWSTNSMRSDNVRCEWECALGLRRPDFIRPTYWETPLPQSPAENLPPPQLKDLHFQHVRPPSVRESNADDELRALAEEKRLQKEREEREAEEQRAQLEQTERKVRELDERLARSGESVLATQVQQRSVATQRVQPAQQVEIGRAAAPPRMPAPRKSKVVWWILGSVAVIGMIVVGWLIILAIASIGK